MGARKGLALLGYFGAGNFGDDLILTWALSVAARCFPEEPVHVSRMGAADYPLPDNACWVKGKSLKTWRPIYKQVRGLLLPGGGIFQDVTSVKSIGLYSAHVRMAAYGGARTGAFGQSLTPFHSSMGRWMAAGAMKTMDFVFLRDAQSLEQAKGMAQEPLPCLDPAFSLFTGETQANTDILGVNLREWPKTEAAAALLKPFIEVQAQRLGLDPQGFALQAEDADWLKKLGLKTIHAYQAGKPPQVFEALLAGQTLAIGMRYHYLLASALRDIPFCCVNYDQKTRSLAEALSQPVLMDVQGSGDLAGPSGQPDPAAQKEQLAARLPALRQEAKEAETELVKRLEAWR